MRRKPRRIKLRHVVRDIDTPELYAALRGVTAVNDADRVAS